MTSFERRQRLLEVLRKKPGITVPELAKVFHVSEGTIRNDLRALSSSQHLTRVRGGAVLKEEFPVRSASFAERMRINPSEKQRIASRAAGLVEEGDSILLDASSSVYHLAPFLQDLKNLTIVTNGLEVAHFLAKNPAHTVILLGGVLRPDGTSVIGHLGEKILADLHIKTAFVSCSGFSVDTGLMETDLQEIQLKSRMIHAADRVVALIDSSKFGKLGLSSFAGTDSLHQIYTDDAISPAFIEQVCRAGIDLLVCGDTTMSTFTSSCEQTPHYKIGFANLSEAEIPFCVDVRRGLEQTAKRAGNIDLILGDNRLNGEVALKVAEDLIAAKVDLAIEFQIDEKIGSVIIDRFQRAGIPVIAVDIPMIGATFFGVDNYRAGYMAGRALGEWMEAHWESRIDRLIALIEPRAGSLPASRIQGQIEGLQSAIGGIPAERQLFLDCGNTSEESENQMAAALKRLPGLHRIAVVSFNDDAAIGALAAARRLKREADITIVGQGADRRVRAEIRQPGTRIIGSTAYWPEHYGEKLLNAALRILNGEAVPPALFMEHIFIHPGNIEQYYPEFGPEKIASQTPEGGNS